LQERRPIRSYVLRQGRVSKAQRRAHTDLLPVYGVPFSPIPLDLDRLFGRTAPRILEIGFGMGETTATIAQEHPENDYLGIEVHAPGVGSLLKRIGDLHLEHLDLRRTCQWADVTVVGAGIANLEVAHFRQERIDEGIVDALLHVDALDRATALAGVVHRPVG